MIRQSDTVIIMPHLGADAQQEYAFNESYTSLRESVPDIQIVVAKNGPACHHPRDVRVSKQGQCKAVNAAVAITNQPWILVTNDDMIYPLGWFQNISDHMVAEPVFCISPKLVEPRLGAPTFIMYFCGGAGGDFDKQKFFDFVNKYHEESDGAIVSSGFNLPFLIHRDLWNTVGGYDINYDPWGSNGDSDLEYKIMLAGVTPLQDQDTLVYHFSQTSGTFHPSNDSYRFRNYAYFKEKWGFDRTDDGIWEATFTIPTKEEGRIYCPDWEGKYGISNS